jgi:hypothetical protein
VELPPLEDSIMVERVQPILVQEAVAAIMAEVAAAQDSLLVEVAAAVPLLQRLSQTLLDITALIA